LRPAGRQSYKAIQIQIPDEGIDLYQANQLIKYARFQAPF
jgi:hypothetical protein